MSTLKSYNFDSVSKTFCEEKGNVLVITEHNTCLERIKSNLADSANFITHCIDKDHWINYIINLESKLISK